MMNSIKNGFIMFLLLSSLTLVACGGGTQANDQSEETENMEADKSGPEYTSAYICPMHCKGSGSDKPGTCPVCKMDYVANEDHQAGDSHEGHNH